MLPRWTSYAARAPGRSAMSPMRKRAAAWACPSSELEPRPPESFPYGSPDLRRLRAGRYRVFYTIDERRKLVQINHVARLS
jgi:ParE toxin of type II toxin-antitoxin system, parDE